MKYQFVGAAMEGLENMAFVANAVSLVTYFFGYMNFSLTKSATTLTNFMGTAFLLALVGGLICDTYLSRFKTCVLFACMELLVSWFNFSYNRVHRPSKKIKYGKGYLESLYWKSNIWWIIYFKSCISQYKFSVFNFLICISILVNWNTNSLPLRRERHDNFPSISFLYYFFSHLIFHFSLIFVYHRIC